MLAFDTGARSICSYAGLLFVIEEIAKLLKSRKVGMGAGTGSYRAYAQRNRRPAR